MLTVLLLLVLALAGSCLFLVKRFLSLPMPQPAKAQASATRASKKDQKSSAALPVPSGLFLPPDFEEDELEAEDLQWLLGKQRALLQKEAAAGLERESAARLAELGHQLDSLAGRLALLQERMGAWKSALLERESLKLAYDQLQSDHLDQQYGMDGLRAEAQRLQFELDAARGEAIQEWEEKQKMKTQLALLRSLSREDS